MLSGAIKDHLISYGYLFESKGNNLKPHVDYGLKAVNENAVLTSAFTTGSLRREAENCEDFSAASAQLGVWLTGCSLFDEFTTLCFGKCCAN